MPFLHYCNTLLVHHFNREQRSNTNKGFVIYGRVKEGRIVPAHVVELRYDPHSFSPSTTARSDWSDLCHRPFTTGKRATGTHWPDGWVSARGGLNALHQTGVEPRLFSHIPTALPWLPSCFVTVRPQRTGQLRFLSPIVYYTTNVHRTVILLQVRLLAGWGYGFLCSSVGAHLRSRNTRGPPQTDITTAWSKINLLHNVP
jgi:hypothetical protein